MKLILAVLLVLCAAAAEASVVVECDPASDLVAGRVIAFRQSANTTNWKGNPNAVINPDLSLLYDLKTEVFLVPRKFWRCGGSPPYAIVREMNGTEKNTMNNPPVPVRGVCDEQHRDTWWLRQGGAGVADALQVCLKTSADAFSWVTVVTAP